MTELVVDASVALTWCFPDEHSPGAARILSLLRVAENRALVPSFFYQEILNAILMAERRQLALRLGLPLASFDNALLVAAKAEGVLFA
jgi:predicted nucleic acid-binding protein